MTTVMSSNNSMSIGGKKPSLNISKGDERYYYDEDDDEDTLMMGDGNDVGSDESDESDDDGFEEDADCPLCLEEMDEGDQLFKPCPCGYQVCRFCWHKIREEGNEKCPACRRTYTDEDVVFEAARVKSSGSSPKGKAQKKKTGSKKGAASPQKPLKKAKAASDQQAQASSHPHHHGILPSRRHLAELRVIQRNLVYVIGISARIANEATLRDAEFFGQYGKILKIVVNRKNLSAAGQTTSHTMGLTSSSVGPSASAYVTFARKEDAAKAIAGIDGSLYDGRVIRATYGTTKYCSFYLKGALCTNAGCMYLHEEGEEDDSFTKDELTAGKLHLHSYIPEKAEAATMKAFGTGALGGVSSAPASRSATPVAAAAVALPQVSRPATPQPLVTSPKPPLYDKTPRSFFERLHKLAAPHRDEEDIFRAEEESMVTILGRTDPVLTPPPGLVASVAVRRPTLGKFDPFSRTEESFSFTPAAARPAPPPPIGSPLGLQASSSGSLRNRSQSDLGPQPAHNILFSSQQQQQQQQQPTQMQHQQLLPNQLFSFLNDTTTTVSAKPTTEPVVEQFFNLFSHNSAHNNPSREHPSIFEDPAIMQARFASQQRMAATASAASTQPQAQPQPTPQQQPAHQTPSPMQFSTVKSGGKKTTTAAAAATAKPAPVTTSANAFSLLQSTSKSSDSLRKPAVPVPGSVTVKAKPAKAAPVLPNDPAILSATAAPHVPYQRTSIAPHTPHDLPADICTALDQQQQQITALHSAMHASWKESARMEGQLWDILTRSGNAPPAKKGSKKQ